PGLGSRKWQSSVRRLRIGKCRRQYPSHTAIPAGHYVFLGWAGFDWTSNSDERNAPQKRAVPRRTRKAEQEWRSAHRPSRWRSCDRWSDHLDDREDRAQQALTQLWGQSEP